MGLSYNIGFLGFRVQAFSAFSYHIAHSPLTPEKGFFTVAVEPTLHSIRGKYLPKAIVGGLPNPWLDFP